MNIYEHFCDKFCISIPSISSCDKANPFYLFADLCLRNEKAKVERLQLELNHDRNHFAEMSAVFEEKMNTFKDRMAVLEVQHTEMSRELKKVERVND